MFSISNSEMNAERIFLFASKVGQHSLGVAQFALAIHAA
jgi:hypothetical protein